MSARLHDFTATRRRATQTDDRRPGVSLSVAAQATPSERACACPGCLNHVERLESWNRELARALDRLEAENRELRAGKGGAE